MKQSDQAGPVDAKQEDNIAEYLLSHPDFFNRHSKLLENLLIPHDCGGAVSLVERQLQQLRQQNQQLRNKLQELVRVARDNDSLSQRMQQLNLALLEATTLTDMILNIENVLREEFNADFAVLRLSALSADDTEVPSHNQLNHDDKLLFEGLLQNGQPVCGRITEAQRQSLFNNAASQVASSAIVPLKGVDWQGLLAVGSSDEGRFHPGMGTLFLSRISELVSHALQTRWYVNVTALAQ